MEKWYVFGKMRCGKNAKLIFLFETAHVGSHVNTTTRERAIGTNIYIPKNAVRVCDYHQNCKKIVFIFKRTTPAMGRYMTNSLLSINGS